MRNLIIILSILLFAVTQNAYAGWRVDSSVSIDETKMEEKICFVVSDFVESIPTSDLPDKDLKQAIGVVIRDDGTTWGDTRAVIVFNDSPHLTGYRDSGEYRTITHRAKFDEKIVSITYTSKEDYDRFLRVDKVGFSSYLSHEKFIGYILNSKTLLTEQERSKNTIYYKHDLGGFKEKYHEARESCGLEITDTVLSPYQKKATKIIKTREELDLEIQYLIATYGNEVDGNHLDVSGITDFNYLFTVHEEFNGDIREWDVSAGTDFSGMFFGVAAFNQDIGDWDVSAGTDFSRMFLGAAAFNQDIGDWDVSAGTDFNGMFLEAAAFNQDIGGWDVSAGIDFRGMFSKATAFNRDIGGWVVSAGKKFYSMFGEATAFNQDIGGWDVSAGTDFSYMFNGATAFNRDIGGWDVSVGTDFSYMFNGATAFNQDLSRWKVNPEDYTESMFEASGVTDFTSYSWWTK